MQSRMCGNEYRTIVVCIDSYDGKVLKGRLYNPFLDGAAVFDNLMQFVLQVEELLDQMNFPQPFTATRAFAQKNEHTPEIDHSPGEKEGEQATFLIRVLFRQNASWQGTVSWLEGKQEEGFRSVLELIMLMDSALSVSADRT